MKFAIGKKLGMTRIFDKEGKNVAVTIVKVLPMVVSQVKKADTDGYSSVQIRAFEMNGDKERDLKVSEFRLDDTSNYKTGKKIDNVFSVGDKIEVQGISKGKGFAGTIKRHNFKRGPESHGGNNVREPGSIGAQQPQRVVLGRRMAGHMGVETITVKNLKIADKDKDIILITGAIPGPNKSIVRVVSKTVVLSEE